MVPEKGGSARPQGMAFWPCLDTFADKRAVVKTTRW